MEYMFLPFKRYADFSGRSRRKEYWMFTLFNIIAVTVLVTLMLGGGLMNAETGGMGALGWVGMGLAGIYGFAIIIPSLAVQVRRFHDQNKTGWLVLLNFVPYVGGIVVLVFMCLEGTRGPNDYGPDPKQMGENAGDIFA